jgi:hypothetical protein
MTETVEHDRANPAALITRRKHVRSRFVTGARAGRSVCLMLGLGGKHESLIDVLANRAAKRETVACPPHEADLASPSNGHGGQASDRHRRATSLLAPAIQCSAVLNDSPPSNSRHASAGRRPPSRSCGRSKVLRPHARAALQSP